MGLSMTRYLLLGYVLLIPVGWSPFPWNIQWCDVVFVGLLVWLMATGQLTRLPVHPVDWLVMGYLLVPLVSFTTGAPLFQGGLEYVKHLSLAAVYVVFCLLARQPAVLAQVLVGFSLAASLLALVGVLAIAAYFGWGLSHPLIGSVMTLPYLGEVFRIRATLFSWEFFGDFLTFVLPMVLGFAMGSGAPVMKRWARWSVLLVIAAAIGTVSRSIAGFVVGGLFYLWRSWATGRRRLLRLALAVVAVLLVLGVNLVSIASVREVRWTFDTNPAIAPPRDLLAFQDPQAGAQRVTLAVSYNPVSYLLLKAVSLEAFWRSPLTGIGLGRFHEETERAYREGRIQDSCRAMDPHSTWFGRLAETGLFGGIALVALWVGFLRVGMTWLRQHANEAESWMVRATVAGLVGLLVNSLSVDLMNFRFLWVGFGVLGSQVRRWTA